MNTTLPPRVQLIADMRRRGMTYDQIAAELGLSKSTVWGYASRAQVTRDYDVEEEETETPREARARVQREAEAGKRCRTCWLLTPCFDHGAA